VAILILLNALVLKIAFSAPTLVFGFTHHIAIAVDCYLHKQANKVSNIFPRIRNI
jgi:hypothetical protein